MIMEEQIPTYTQKDFKNECEVRWCPGCGDHAIMAAILRAMANQGIKHEDFAVISGIGCSSRFPYYMNTYGFHTIHGRASAVASGVKCANPKICVWQVTGDGDALAIGGNHFIHEIRRNVNVNLVLFNNKIYGLTKGQYSPTTDRGAITKSSPFGTIEDPFNPGKLVLGAGGTFYARTVDNNVKFTEKVFEEAALHEGTSVCEVLQNCVIYNDGVHHAITDPEYRDEHQIFLQHGEKMIFGTNKDKGLVFENGRLKAVTIGKDGYELDDILVHDAEEPTGWLQFQLCSMSLPDLPVAMGIIRNVKAPVYDQVMTEQINEIKEKSSIKCMDDLLHSGDTWNVE